MLVTCKHGMLEIIKRVSMCVLYTHLVFSIYFINIYRKHPHSLCLVFVCYKCCEFESFELCNHSVDDLIAIKDICY